MRSRFGLGLDKLISGFADHPDVDDRKGADAFAVQVVRQGSVIDGPRGHVRRRLDERQLDGDLGHRDAARYPVGDDDIDDEEVLAVLDIVAVVSALSDQKFLALVPNDKASVPMLSVFETRTLKVSVGFESTRSDAAARRRLERPSSIPDSQSAVSSIRRKLVPVSYEISLNADIDVGVSGIDIRELFGLAAEVSPKMPDRSP